MDDHKFKDAYEGLNSMQRKAVDTTEGPVMVIAGPGTGKTQILTLRIANILRKTDTLPENILALTFTESGAKAMRERLHKYIGAAAFRVAIYTFHGFAERLIRSNPDAFVRVIGGRPASDLDKISLIQTILDNPDFKLLRPIGDPSYYISHIIRILSELKKEYISPDVFARIINEQQVELKGIEKVHQKGAHKGKVRGEYTKKEKTIQKNLELNMVYREYESLLATKRLYDFEDMIIETIHALETKEDLLRELQETYQYVLADEHQDVNGSQNRILELLCSFHEHPNIFVVGDEKQAIYRFQGASLENFLYFEDVYKHTEMIALTENYRSGQMILDAAHSLVAVDDGPLRELRIPLIAKAVSTSSVERRIFSHQGIEDSWLILQIRKHIESGVSPNEIAVIVRTNREVEQFAQLLRKENIPVLASADGDILDHPITHVIEDFINAIVHSHNEEALFTLLHGPYWGISTNDVIRIARARSYSNSLYSILSSSAKLTEIGVVNISGAENIIQTLEEARKVGVLQAPHRVLEFVLSKSGFLDYVLASDPVEGGRVVRRLYDEVEEMVLRGEASTLADVRAVFTLRKEHRIPLTAPYISVHTNAVQVMTAHKSKGLEFEVVFVPHAVDSVWGGSTKRTYFEIPFAQRLKSLEYDVIDDERRLLYVAMTRAKTYLYLSNADVSSDGKELIASRLFEDITDTFIEHKSTTADEADFNPVSVLQKMLPRVPVDAMLFETHLREKGMSATALNNYMHSPWNYVYRNVLKIPEIQTLPLQFGTAVHGVMEWVSGIVSSTGSVPSVTQIKEALENELSKLPITKTEFVQLHEKGFEALVTYVNHIATDIPQNAKVEFAMRVTLPTGLPDFPELTLTGKLDRLDFDTNGNLIQVVDYKTGKPKTRNEIEGNTKNSNGDYKRQLVFYALILSLYGDERYLCKRCKLSFIEPDAKGVVHEEVFEVTEAEISELKEELITITKEIISGSFLSVPCDPESSDYCHLASQLFL